MVVQFMLGDGSLVVLPVAAGPALRLLAFGRPLWVVCSGPRAGFCAWGSVSSVEGEADGPPPELAAVHVAALSDVGLVACGRISKQAGGWAGSLVTITDDGLALAAGRLPPGWSLAVENDLAALAAFGMSVSIHGRRGGGQVVASRHANGVRVELFDAAGRCVGRASVEEAAAGELAGEIAGLCSLASTVTAAVRVVVDIPRGGGMVTAALAVGGLVLEATRQDASEFWPSGVVVDKPGRPLWPALLVGLVVGQVAGVAEWDRKPRRSRGSAAVEGEGAPIGSGDDEAAG